MANHGDKQTDTNDPTQKRSEKSGEKRVFGAGMTSLDSTQAALSAETGLPDPAAMKGAKRPQGTDEDGADTK